MFSVGGGTRTGLTGAAAVFCAGPLSLTDGGITVASIGSGRLTDVRGVNMSAAAGEERTPARQAGLGEQSGNIPVSPCLGSTAS